MILSDCRMLGEVGSWKWLQNHDASWQDETSFIVTQMRMVERIFLGC